MYSIPVDLKGLNSFVHFVKIDDVQILVGG